MWFVLLLFICNFLKIRLYKSCGGDKFQTDLEYRSMLEGIWKKKLKKIVCNIQVSRVIIMYFTYILHVCEACQIYVK